MPHANAAYPSTDSTAGPVIVGVPVRDEAALLPGFLDALAAQRDAPPFTLCIALDGCTDDSAAVIEARRAALPYDVVTVAIARGEPNAGRARWHAMELACAQSPRGDAILLSTDADSVPDRDWLRANVAALALADLVTGRIVRDAACPSPVQDRIEAYYDALFALRRRIDPVPWEAARTHHYTAAASLALRAGTYRALGTFDCVAAAEDARLVDRARWAGYRVRQDAAIRVTTSSRRHGRTTDGLADHLRRLDAGDDAATMAHPADVAWRYRGHAAARTAWPAMPVASERLAPVLGRSAEDIRRIAADAVNAEAFAMRVVPEIPGGERQVPLDVAERALAALEDEAKAA